MAKTMTDPRANAKGISDPQQDQKTLRGWTSDPEILEGLQLALGDTMDAKAFRTHMLIAFQDPAIAPCTEFSKFEAMHKCASFGLLPHLNQVALIPRKQNGALELTVMPEWRGYKALMERHPAVEEVLCYLVHDSDTFAYDAMTDTILEHSYDPLDGNRDFDDKEFTHLRGLYLKIIFNDARGIRHHFTTVKEVLKRRKCAQTMAIWHAWPKEMAMKTCYNDGYSRQVVPMDPQSQSRMIALAEQDNVFLGNDPSRVVEQQAPRIPAMPSRTQQAMETLKQQQPPAAEPKQEAEPESPAEPEKPKAKGKPTTTPTPTASNEPPPEMPKSLTDYTGTMHAITKPGDAVRCWVEQIKTNAPDPEAYDQGTAMRDWKLSQLGIDDPEAFVTEWEQAQQTKTGAKQGELL